MKPFHEVVLPCRTTHGKFFLHHVLRGQEHDPYHHYLCKDNAVGFYPLEMNQIFIRSSWRPQLSTELCGCSHLTEDHGKVYMDAGMLQLHNPLQKKNTHTFSGCQTHHTQAFPHLWNQILLDPLQLGLLAAIFGHHRLLIELVGQVSVLVVVQRAGTQRSAAITRWRREGGQCWSCLKSVRARSSRLSGPLFGNAVCCLPTVCCLHGTSVCVLGGALNRILIFFWYF